MTRPFIHLFSLAILLVGFAASHAQPAEKSSLVVGELEIEFIDLQNVTQELVRANIQTSEGRAYDESLIDSDIRSLYRTGLFEYIEVKRDFKDDERVDLLFELRPKYRVEKVVFEGNDRISLRRLRREAKIKQNDALDERRVRLDVEAL